MTITARKWTDEKRENMEINKRVLNVDRDKEMAFIIAILTDNTGLLLGSYWEATGVKKDWGDKKYAIMRNGKKIGSAYEIDEITETW